MCESGGEVLVTDGAHAAKCACAGLRVCDPLELLVKAIYQIWDLEEEERGRERKRKRRRERGKREMEERNKEDKKQLNNATGLSTHTHLVTESRSSQFNNVVEHNASTV